MPRPDTPSLAVDIIIALQDRPGCIVLIERRNPPYGWALPGGFVDLDETLEQAAVREAREETGLDVELELLLGCYSDPARDPRGHTASVVYIAEAVGEPQARDDAALAGVYVPEALPALCFDHERILADYLRYRRNGRLPAPWAKKEPA